MVTRTELKDKERRELTILLLSSQTGIAVDATRRYLNGFTVDDISLAKLLEKYTGVDRRAWMYPDEFDNPFHPIPEKSEKLLFRFPKGTIVKIGGRPFFLPEDTVFEGE